MTEPPCGPPGPSATDGPGAPPAPRSRWRSVLGFIIGVLLLAAAVRAVAGQDLASTWDTLRRATPAAAAGALLLPLANWALMSATFTTLMRRYGRVGVGEMAALIGSSWLLNYLPMKPGLVGRLAYHKAVNGIPLTDSVRAIAGNIAAGFLALGFAGALAAGAPATVTGQSVPARFLGGAAVITGALAGLSFAVGRTTPGGRGRYVLMAAALRFVDLLVWALRYGLVFDLVGAPIDAPAALALAVVSQAAALVPIVGNGLGLTEWAVGLTAATLPAWMSGGTGPAQSVGLLAALVNRAAEIAVALPVGLASAWWLSRRWARGAPRAGGTDPVGTSNP